MSYEVDNNAFEVVITPSRKRKRESGAEVISGTPSLAHKPAYTNSGFSSTPKKEIKSLIQKFNRFPPNKRPPLAKRNDKSFPFEQGLEVKSISDLVNQKSDIQEENPYEVIRKPPKKKKKNDIDQACFVNPGLNLELPEKQFNPFEVKRNPPEDAVKSHEPQCFINPALNIRSQESNASRNPYEIQRINPINQEITNGIENPALDLASGPLKIGISFKPTVGCRLDFHNLTPSKMLAEKLVFSPMNRKSSRVLADISEEDATKDIGRELDLYQLELENSINEAKQKKKGTGARFSEKLDNIEEDSQEQDENASPEPTTPQLSASNLLLKKAEGAQRLEDVDTPPVQKITKQDISTSNANECISANEDVQVVDAKHACEESFTDDEDIDYDDDDEEEQNINFKAPAPFIRAYRKPDSVADVLKVNANKKTKEDVRLLENPSKMRDVIRNSIRKLMHPKKVTKNDNLEKKRLSPSDDHSTGHHIMETLRHSFRRRPHKPNSEVECPGAREMSIVDTTERTFKLKTNLIQPDSMNNDEPIKSFLRSSIRKSTRGVKNQIMKSVFHKNNDEYRISCDY